MVEVNPTEVVMGQAVPGAVEAGPASIGGMSVISRTELPGEFNVAGSRYSVLQKNLQPGEEFQGDDTVPSSSLVPDASPSRLQLVSSSSLARL